MTQAEPDIDFEKVITAFYDRVFADMVIGYFFHGLDKAQLIAHQIDFVTNLLGYSQGEYKDRTYSGKPLRAAHSRHAIRKAHFDRRQVILRETLRDHGVPDAYAEEWLAKEAKFFSQVVKS